MSDTGSVRWGWGVDSSCSEHLFLDWAELTVLTWGFHSEGHFTGTQTFVDVTLQNTLVSSVPLSRGRETFDTGCVSLGKVAVSSAQ